jgi:DNA-binding LacI/PurR family transcriptional regulator
VSESTVSYALSGVRAISPETRERVLAAAQQLGYTPNKMAQGLAGKRAGLIALMFPLSNRGLDLDDYDYVEAASGVLETAGFQLLMWPNPVEDVDALKRIASQRLVDGVVLMELRTNDPRPELLRKEGIPFVMIGRTDTGAEAAWVDADFDAWGPLAVEILSARGHASTLFVSPPQQVVDSGYAPLSRIEGSLLSSARAKGMSVVVARVAWTIKAGRDAILDSFARHPEITSVVSFNEMATIGALEGLTSLGKKVPSDVSVLQFGIDAAAAEATNPAQNTIGVDGKALGVKAAEFLLDRIAGKAGPLTYLRPPVYVDRGSVTTTPSLS